MQIKTAEYLMSNDDYRKCVKPDKPEFAFIGRSNVGKSSLINMLTSNSKLAKTSASPGKTQKINHFVINNQWYLVDLPGYGYAKVSKSQRAVFRKMIDDYILNRQNLVNLFVLIDCRHEPQDIDVEFINWLGESRVPFTIIFTKADKIGPNALKDKVEAYKEHLLQTWETLPDMLVSSAVSKMGQEEILDYIEKIIKELNA
ncbi:MAG: YihA family ribosome biogenesis GTP-binding protein [Bacteroidales bacterium]|nr:YihA family ribosome biogenesis GTP-binding protein [Bacteroidales bacterium]MBQ1719030.1 YihA family ribosome biogenesis GTP-binding protein [Bacteroidales bacterium]MBQ1731826.1 YihA family ribosome biogenesis GTP-binding protein [Bacteroidales bacterium]MBQ2352595.1 YihA family ribosome biogenesis GTP-binding protein [Bacteroidales bacterium]